MNRTLGDLQVSALGFGCWAVGGPFYDTAGRPLGWGEVDDDESIRALRWAMDLGVTSWPRSRRSPTRRPSSLHG